MTDSRIADLRAKEIINIHDGNRFGMAADLEFDTESGRITALVVPGPYRILGLFGKSGDYVIPWESIRRIGDDIILVDFDPGDSMIRQKQEKKPNFSL